MYRNKEKETAFGGAVQALATEILDDENGRSTYPAAKPEEDTKRRQDDGYQDVYAFNCPCHLLTNSLLNYSPERYCFSSL
ncbi:hypothetical protein D5086_009666 [Populus alba]|uniref:Uncharacterized protein n=2 Tax=Populus TaxID=3689 RepID=A0ACC4C7U6_POPAL|nr:hypothetical protein POTOM_018309 [Populus tomentosa]